MLSLLKTLLCFVVVVVVFFFLSERYNCYWCVGVSGPMNVKRTNQQKNNTKWQIMENKPKNKYGLNIVYFNKSRNASITCKVHVSCWENLIAKTGIMGK